MAISRRALPPPSDSKRKLFLRDVFAAVDTNRWKRDWSGLADRAESTGRAHLIRIVLEPVRAAVAALATYRFWNRKVAVGQDFTLVRYGNTDQLTRATLADQPDPLRQFHPEGAADKLISDPTRPPTSVSELKDGPVKQPLMPPRAVLGGMIGLLTLGLAIGAISRAQRVAAPPAQLREVYSPVPAPAPDSEPVVAAAPEATPPKQADLVRGDADPDQSAARSGNDGVRTSAPPTRRSTAGVPSPAAKQTAESTALPPALPGTEPVQPALLNPLSLGPTTMAETLAPPAPARDANVLPDGPGSDVDAAMRTVNRYGEALSRMDVAGAAQAWPSVDHRALSDAFKTLDKNNVTFNACAVEIGAGGTAVATCRASIEYVPKVGLRTPRLTSQRWRFTMKRVVGDWQIQSTTTVAER